MTLEESVIQGLSYGLSAALEVREAGRKGRGVFTTAPVSKGGYLCEYRTTKVYHPSKKAKYESEYDRNDEGSYCLETQYGKRLVFDATRCYDQFGRYINHSTKSANCRYWRPLFVRGKMRVAFVATRDIEANEELLYDYGVRGLDWMVKSPTPSPKKKGKTPVKSFESYRRRRFCPVPGCPVRKALKKLPNHLKQKHPALTSEESARMLRIAKYQAPGGGQVRNPALTQKTIAAFFGQEAMGDEPASKSSKRSTTTPKRKHTPKPPAPTPQPTEVPDTEEVMDVEGASSSTSRARASTRHYGTFDVPKSPFLSSLLSHATDRFGMGMGQAAAKELLADVNKFLWFAGKDEVQVAHLFDTNKVREYLFKLEEDGIRSSGQLTKLSRISTALSYASSTSGWVDSNMKPKVADAKELFSRWSKRLQREKTTQLKGKLPAQSQEVREQDLTEYGSLLSNDLLLRQVKEALAGPDPPSDDEFDLVKNFIALYLFIRCAQRKSAVEGLTIAEFEGATRVEGSSGPHWICHVTRHKTASSGPAKMVVDDATKAIMDQYLLHRRGRGTSDRLLVNHKGTASNRLPVEVQRFAADYGVVLPTPTLHRKVMGTKAAHLPQQTQEKVAGLMAHSLATQRRYYRSLQDNEHTVEAFEAISSLLPVPPSTSDPTPPLKKIRFLPEQLADIEKAFASHIEMGKCPSLKECGAYLAMRPIPGRSPKHIQDRVRTVLRNKK